MDHRARLIEVAGPSRPAGAVLVMHGGSRKPGRPLVSPAQLSVLRMIPVARTLARAGRGELAVYRLLNSYRGWHEDRTPVEDAEWALGQIADRHGAALPICLVGHSLGGRAALFTAAHTQVLAAVALAPWLYAEDRPQGLEGKPFLFLHGTSDRVASLERAHTVADSLSPDSAVRFLEIPGGKHAMLRHHGQFTDPTAEFVTRQLLAEPAQA